MRSEVAGRRREPVSFEQERVWREEQLAPGQRPSAAVVAIRGPLDTRALGEAVTSLAARHPSLRTTFGAVDDSPVAVITDPPRAALQITTVSPDRARAAAMASAHEPIPLGPGPLLRASLIRQASDHHLLVLAAHRMIADEPSLAIMLTELGPLYAAHLVPGRGADSLPAPPQQTCAGYAIWQRDMLAGGGFEADLRYWRGHLGQAVPLRLLPSAPPTDPAASARHAVTYQARPGTLRRLREFAAAHGVRAQHVITAACLAVSARYTSGDDTVTGCTLSSRGQPGLGSLIGQFGNVLPLRVSLAADPSFGELASRVAVAMTRAAEHGHVPFQALAAALCPPREPGSYPFFEVTIDVAAGCGNPAAVPAPPSLPGLTTEVLDVTAPALAAGLCITAKVTGGELELTAEYPEGRCDPGWALALLTRTGTALAEGMAAPGGQISALPLLTGDERASAAGVHGPQRPYPFVTLHELVWRQAARTPHAPAVTWQHDEVTYAQLRHAAQRAAASLQAAGAGAGTTVGVLLPGGDLVAGILGALAAGGAFTQLDPAEPAERVAWRCELAGVNIVLTTQALRPLLPAAVTAVTSWDAESGPPPGPATDGLPSRGAGMDAPCAVLFTGSEPEAVPVSHRNVVAAVSGLLHALGAERFRGSLLTAALSGADGLAQLFPALVTGGTVVLPGQDGPSSAAGRVPGGVTIMAAAPADVSRSLRQAPLPPTVRTLMLTGGRLPDGLTEQVFQRSSVNDICVCYGCAETTTYTLMRRLTRGGEQPGHPRPLGGVTALVLDRYGSPAPPGVAGELFIAGPMVASGYLGGTEDSRQRFRKVTVAGTGQPGYRTGEAARILPGGELELPGQPGQPAEAPGAGPAAAAAAGPEPAYGEFVAPRTGTELQIAAIYAEVLGASRVGALDDFFDLGGSSLEGTAVLGRIRQRFAVTIPMSDFMGAATVEVIAQAVDDSLLAQVTAEDLAAAMGMAPGLTAPTEAHDHG
jgi:non-ribosomal peptide synthetase component F/acyl carrier protein